MQTGPCIKNVREPALRLRITNVHSKGSAGPDKHHVKVKIFLCLNKCHAMKMHSSLKRHAIKLSRWNSTHSCGSSVSIVTRRQAGRPGCDSRQDLGPLLPAPPHPHRLRDSPSPPFNVYWGFFPQGQNLHTVPRPRTHGATPPPPQNLPTVWFSTKQLIRLHAVVVTVKQSDRAIRMTQIKDTFGFSLSITILVMSSGLSVGVAWG
jgi:hypothetical protein